MAVREPKKRRSHSIADGPAQAAAGQNGVAHGFRLAVILPHESNVTGNYQHRAYHHGDIANIARAVILRE
jgi:hypothetical protein